MWAGGPGAYTWSVGGHSGWPGDNAQPKRVSDANGVPVSALSLAAFALLALSLPADAAKGGRSKGPATGDWVIQYEYGVASLSPDAPYWEATLHSGGDLELTLLAFPQIAAFFPTSVWGTWDTLRGGRTLVLDPDPYTHLEREAIGAGCYAGTITYTDSVGTQSGPWEGCPLQGPLRGARRRSAGSAFSRRARRPSPSRSTPRPPPR